MDDTKLLELAGRAAGEQYDAANNPLERDDLALRLAVKLQINVEWWVSMPDGIAGKLTFDGNGVILMSNVQDKAAMLRKCITRAAAELARAQGEKQ